MERQSSITQYLKSAGLPFRGEKFQAPDWAKRLKIDVGLSYSASNSIEWIRRDPDLMVLGLEPLPDSVRQLRTHIDAQPDKDRILKQLFIIPVALGLESRDANFYVTENDPSSSSLLEPSTFPVSQVITVPVFTLQQVIDSVPMHHFGRIDHLKLDCQGFDLDIIMSSKDLLSHVAVVTAEAEQGQYLNSHNDVESLEKYMTSMGFVFYNRRSRIRVWVGNYLAKFRVFNKLGIRLPYLKHRDTASDELAVDVQDPTFFNTVFMSNIRNGSITAYQEG
jgi:FkbM family methyltransferase